MVEVGIGQHPLDVAHFDQGNRQFFWRREEPEALIRAVGRSVGTRRKAPDWAMRPVAQVEPMGHQVVDMSNARKTSIPPAGGQACCRRNFRVEKVRSNFLSPAFNSCGLRMPAQEDIAHLPSITECIQRILPPKLETPMPMAAA